jgi:NADH-quinone oxidoreductase subunit D
LKEFENLFERNRIFIDRTVNVGAITAEQAMAYGFTGPNLRAAGVDYDACSATVFFMKILILLFLLENQRYVRSFCVRNAEVWESLSYSSSIRKMPEGNEFHADVPDYYLPPKEDVYIWNR